MTSNRTKYCWLCNKPLKKGRRKFCSNSHKDKWHNINNPRGYGLRSGSSYVKYHPPGCICDDCIDGYMHPLDFGG
jgi:hypothetical protein